MRARVEEFKRSLENSNGVQDGGESTENEEEDDI